MTDATGWTPDAIREAIRKRGTTIYDLSAQHGLSRALLNSNLVRRQPSSHFIVAGFLGLPMRELWPQWYDEDDAPRPAESRGIDRATFDAVLAFVAAGEPVKAACRRPGMPSQPAVNRFLNRHPELKPAWRAAQGKRAGAGLAEEHFEAAIAEVEAGEKVVDVTARPGRPSMTVISERCRNDPVFARRWSEAMGSRPGARVSAERFDAVLDVLASGRGTLRGSTGQRLVSQNALNRERRQNPNFAARLGAIYIPRGFLSPEDRQARAAARRNHVAPFAHREAMTRALRSEEVYAIAHAAVPRGLDPFMRDDVVSEVVVGILSGEIRPEDAGAAARRFAGAYFGRRDISMDADFGDGMTLAGIVSDGSFDLGDSGIRVRQAAW